MSASPFRLPIRYQIVGLLTVFIAVIAGSSFYSTQSFLHSDKIATVRELQTLQVGELGTELRERISTARAQLRTGALRLLSDNNVSRNPGLDPELWRYISVRDRSWVSPKANLTAPPVFPAELPPRTPQENMGLEGSALAANTFHLKEWVQIQEGTELRSHLVHALMDSRLLLPESVQLDRGPIKGLVLDVNSAKAAGLSDSAAAGASFKRSIWFGSEEAREKLDALFSQPLPESFSAALLKVANPTAREIIRERADDNLLVGWSSVVVPDSKLHLNVLSIVDRGTLLQGFRRFILEQAFVVFLIFGAGLVFALIVASRMSKPIEQLVQAARVLETGDFDIRVKVTRNDELGDLGGAFNHMAVSLHERETALKEAQGALVQSEKLAALGTLSAGIAHEVKNPLAGILGNADLAMNQFEAMGFDAATPLRRYIEVIQKETKRCRGIVDSLMRFSRQEKAEQVLVDLEIIAWEAVHLVEYSLNLARVRVEKNFADEVQVILGNSNQVEQVLLNMLQNAGHAMPDGGVVRLATEFHPDAADAPVGRLIAYKHESFQGPFCRLSISDAGGGMSEEVQRKIFEPFFTTKPKGLGTGLGLSVTMGILGDHRARISITSAPGEGTTFFLDFMAKGPRTLDIHAQLEEIRGRKAGGTKLTTDVSAHSEGAGAPASAVAPPPPPVTDSALRRSPELRSPEPHTAGTDTTGSFQLRKPSLKGGNGKPA